MRLIAITLGIALTACQQVADTTATAQGVSAESSGVQCVPYTFNGQELECKVIGKYLNCNPTSEAQQKAVWEWAQLNGNFKRMGCAWRSVASLDDEERAFYTSIEMKGDNEGRRVCHSDITEIERKVSCD